MTKLNRTLAAAIALALSGAGIAYSFADTSATEPNSNAQTASTGDQGPTQVTETFNGGPTEKQSEAMSEEGLNAVRNVHLARMALNDGYTDNAKRLLTDAKVLLAKVKTADKPVTVAVDVKVGDKKVHSDTNTVTPDLIPILSELQVVEDYTQVPAKAQAVNKAKEHMSKGERQNAIDVLKVADVGLASENVSMPLADTINWVDQSLKLIDSGKLYEANLELKKVSDGLVRQTTELAHPTVAAADETQTTAKAKGDEPKATSAN